MKVDQARQFKELQKENARPKRAVANLTLDKLIWSSTASRSSMVTRESNGRGPHRRHEE